MKRSYFLLMLAAVVACEGTETSENTAVCPAADAGNQGGHDARVDSSDAEAGQDPTSKALEQFSLVAAHKFETPSFCTAAFQKDLVPSMIYDPCTNQASEFMKGVEAAAKSDKLVMAVFSATWCPWCQSWHTRFADQAFLQQKDGDGFSLDGSFVFEEVGVNTSAYVVDDQGKIELDEHGAPVTAKVPVFSGLFVQEFVSVHQSVSRLVAFSGLPGGIVLDPLNPRNAVVLDLASLEANDPITGAAGYDFEKVRQALKLAHRQVLDGRTR